eukprot:scaffold721_cov131-Cylindrotheca_fusiformis.AAC.65
MSKHLLRYFVSHPLPFLKQGSTLQIRSSIKQTNLSIRSQWRDDGHLSMLQQLGVGGVEAEVVISKESDKMTSMGRNESHVLVQVQPKKDVSSPDDNTWRPQTHPRARDQSVEKKVILDDGTILPDSEQWSRLAEGFRRIEYSDDIAHITDERVDIREEETSIELEVPEKVNLECDLSNGGSVSIHNKIEGDVQIFTSDGNIIVKKLRGHAIDIHAAGPGNLISSSDLLEAQSLKIILPQPGRLRVKRIHAKSCKVVLGNERKSEASKISSSALFDNDDSGAVCDISSLYATGEAYFNVKSTDETKQAVRIKSNHGHVVLEVSGSKPATKNEAMGTSLPLVDVGGVNGSCEVFIRRDGSAMGSNDDERTSGRIHFDSISPDSVSVVHADFGSVNVTVDRKVETDVRMVAASNAASIDIDTLIEDSDGNGDSNDEIRNMLSELDHLAEPKDGTMVKIQTKTFTDREVGIQLSNVEYVDGWLENKSEEPDSRFDRKIRGSSPSSGGKIRLEGAQDQALKGFQGQKVSTGSTYQRPLLVVSSAGGIILETLSWLGNIARRYGMDDGRDQEKLGRTATRRGRSLVDHRKERMQ